MRSSVLRLLPVWRDDDYRRVRAGIILADDDRGLLVLGIGDDDEDGLHDRNFLFALGMKSPAENSESTRPLTKREYPGRGRESRT